ncbi:Succinate semialdehyde dehydrogenase [NAD(P)+] Sad [Ruegeria denitrificans]|uniref:Succinate semialdehyde dehydrogenase [NAD(P)+] Sad n=1 Tax=Ruegeria denitrificans TaxID=1715692 RepID=A0A0P1IS59_9RHOB|nr:aldehyde dehydrogenase family protein [Ruegeria denitrificans]CUK18280.1 Succinate semialdehyde dehydrogenase [NAD(P)+] Sad [Ruegeria denitrificans]
MTEIKCVSPINDEVYVTRQAMTKDEALSRIERSKAAGKAWAARPVAERRDLVVKAIKQLATHRDESALAVANMMGRPKDLFFEFNGCIERAEYMAKIAEDTLKPIVTEDSDRFERRIEKEPVGVVFIVAPWNYPFLTTINSLVPALIAGNSVIMKHAAQTLIAGEFIVKAFEEVGFPVDVLQNVFFDHSTTSELIGEGHFGFVNFTGSVGGGQAMERAAAGTFTAVGTELGGKDPAYVMDDANLDAAVATLMDGAFFNAGQCCCGIERVYVHESKFDEFVEKAVAEVNKLKLGNPLEEGTTLGPMANVRFAQEVRDQVKEAIADGATALIDPANFPADDGGAYLAPQILVDVTHDMRVMRDESFGPVVGIMKVSSDEEAIELMNDSEFGLTVSLWTEDADRASKIGTQVETGTVFMNRCDYLDPAVCWTGCKNTGRGATLSVLGYNSLTRPKSYHLKKVL